MKITLSEVRQIIREELVRKEKLKKLYEQSYRPVSDYPLGVNMKDAPGSNLIEQLQIALGLSGADADGLYGPNTASGVEAITGYRDVLSSDEYRLIRNVRPNLEAITDPTKRAAMDGVVRTAVDTVRAGKARPEDRPTDIDPDIAAASEVELETAAAGEGSIDGMTPSSWLTAYWTARRGPHARGQTLDLRPTRGSLKVINRSRDYVEYAQLLDETRDAVEFTNNPSYSRASGGARRAHYHIEARSITAEGEEALRPDPRFGLGVTEYLRSNVSSVEELNDVGTKLMQLLAYSAKELKEEGEDIDQLVITSAFRDAAHQTSVMIGNWEDSERNDGPGGGTTWLINTYADDNMAKALGKALQGGIVVTTSGNPSSRVAISTIDMQDGRGPQPSNMIEPTNVA
jgi:hypothetical protein